VDVSRQGIEVHIEELVLHGFPRGGTHVLAAAIEAELGRLVAAHGLPTALRDGTSISALNSPSIETTTSERPSVLGARIGRSVYQSLGVQK
jgi:hypothetical protein